MMLKSILILFFLSISIQAEEFDIYFYYHQKVPLVIKDEKGSLSGIYYDAMVKILDETKIKYKISQKPNARRRRAFAEGETVISCCSNPDWRNKSSEKDVQIFSTPFMVLEDVIIHHKDHVLERSKVFDNSFALIRGYTYKNEDSFKKITRLKNEEAVLSFLNNKRASIGIVNKTIAQYYIKKYGLNLKIGPTFSHDNIHIRIHKKKKHLVKPINNSIEKLKNKKYFSKLKEKYVESIKKELSQNSVLNFLVLK